MIDRDELDRLLHQVARSRAGDPAVPPGNHVLHQLRERGRARRRRTRLAAAAVAVAGGGLLAAAGLAGGDARTDRVDTIDEPSVTTDPSTSTTTATTTTSPSSTTTSSTDTSEATGTAPTSIGGPAVGAPASAYIGVTIVRHDNDGRLWTDDGRSLGYLSAGGEVIGDIGAVDVAQDGDHVMFWLLDSRSPDSGTIVDAVDVPVGLTAAGTTDGCTSTATDAAIVAAVATTPTGEVTGVAAAWTVEAEGPHFEPIPDVATVSCTV